MNYTIEEVQVKLSLRKYIEGGGILKEVKVNGVRFNFLAFFLL